MSEVDPRHRDRRSRRRRILKRVGIGLLVLVILVTTGGYLAYKKLENNIQAIPTLGLGSSKDRPTVQKVAGPTQPINVLVMGSDSRKGTNIGGQTPGLSDTTILLHISADRKRAYGVSLPRDLMVNRPTCLSKDGKSEIPGGLTQFNDAFAVGGPTCTVRTVEQLTNVHINHFVVVDFEGFKKMVDAVHGVKVCVPTEVNDTEGHIHLPAGTYNVFGAQALDYVRVRNDIGAPTGDIGRMKRQQAFISAMISKVVSAGTLANPIRLYNFLDAATSSLSTDPAFANLKDLVELGSSLKDIGLDRIQFVTVPNEDYPLNHNRLQLAQGASLLFHRLRFDKPLGALSATAVSPTTSKPGTTGVSTSPSPGSSSSSQSAKAAEAARKQAALEAGLCT